MNNPIQLTDTITTVRTSISRSFLRRGFLLIPLSIAIAGLALSPQARAVCQEGCLAFQNTVLGEDALLNNIDIANTAIGSQALFTNTTGALNTAIGSTALLSNAAGSNNTAIGSQALFTNTTGDSNTASGVDALFSNTTGVGNTANGLSALQHNTTAFYNTATGYFALSSTAGGSFNTANGAFALLYSLGSNNTANGYSALGYNTTGSNNTATGFQALYFNTTGKRNTAHGLNALYANTTGSDNTALGNNALLNNTVGSNNIVLGQSAGINLTSGSNNVYIGAFGATSESNTIRIGRGGLQTAVFVTGIWGATALGGVPVVIDVFGHLGTITSSARYKESIQPMDKASEAVLALQPVTFRYKHDLDPNGIPQFGLVAEQVEKINPDLVVRDKQGKPYTVRYEAVNAMLLNEFLKEHRKVDAQATTIADVKATVAKQEQIIAQQQNEFRATVEQQQKEISALTAAFKAQAAQIQEVNEQLRTAKLAPRLVNNQ
jgi:hypothetical protein